MAHSRVLATQLIRSIKNGAKDLEVHYVTKTETWERTLLSKFEKKEFVEIVEKNLDNVPANAAIVGVKYAC
jgi:hypothetical protein